MKIILYYLFLLLGIGLITGFIISETGADTTMGMRETLSICGALVAYAVALSFVGEGKAEDERALTHRHLANRAGLLAGTAVLVLGIIVQLFISHKIDYWLLSGLVVINLTKIISLIWLNYKK